MITVNIAGTEAVLATLRRVEFAGFQMRPLLVNIGEYLTVSTKRRFMTSTAPDGTKWAPNAQATYMKLLSGRHTTKSGKINKSGVNKVMSKRPLIQSFALGTEIHWQLIPQGVEVGSNKIYAPPMQFGLKKGQLGSDRRGHPLPWGNVPKREFLGISREDEHAIMAMALIHMKRAMWE